MTVRFLKAADGTCLSARLLLVYNYLVEYYDELSLYSRDSTS